MIPQCTQIFSIALELGFTLYVTKLLLLLLLNYYVVCNILDFRMGVLEVYQMITMYVNDCEYECEPGIQGRKEMYQKKIC